jgi:serine/threonine protein kinase
VNGRYRIIGEVGRGGMGVVYKAQDTRLERTVALKFLTSPSTLGEESRERFIHEAQAISELDHPNIGTVHEFDQTEAGEMYIVMAFYGGEPLRNKIQRGPVAVEDAIDTAIQVAGSAK